MKRHAFHGPSLHDLWSGSTAATLPYQPHSPTSRLAASVAKLKAGSQRHRIYQYICSRGAKGAADFEGIRDLKPEIRTIENVYRERRIKLLDAGLIKFAGFTRTSPSGGECDCYVAVDIESPVTQEV